MPPKPLFTDDQIAQAAFNVVREEGLDALTARRVATELNCTVRPIYHSFENMEELKKEVLKRAGAFSIEFLLNVEADTPYEAMGFAYVRFAQEEPELFKTVYMTKNETVDYHEDRIRPLIERLKAYPELSKLSDDQIIELNDNFWIYSHGLSTLLTIGALNMDNREIRDRLKAAGKSFLYNVTHKSISKA